MTLGEKTRILYLSVCAMPFSIGCTGGSDSGTETGSGCAIEEARIEIGTGSSEFVTLGEQEPVMMVHGPQGGWHMLGSIWVWNTS